MPKVLVLYYSSYGHIEAMAQAVVEGARSTGAEVAVKRVPETVPEEVARKAATSSTKRPRSPRLRSYRATTPLSSGPAPATGGSRRRWQPFSTGPAACGRAAR